LNSVFQEKGRAKKNPKRVGAAWAEKVLKMRKLKELGVPEAAEFFADDGNSSENWLPSFGRVFNEGPRRMTVSEFQREFHTTTTTTTTTTTSTTTTTTFTTTTTNGDLSEISTEVPKEFYGPLF